MALAGPTMFSDKVTPADLITSPGGHQQDQGDSRVANQVHSTTHTTNATSAAS